ncbi:DUF5067 domain-containing protein [Jeotgalibaca caeni]|uniref:DUF5067 domain-containing protein n=1 Tax=Jeotgalibaca caeni TaxID=3028623 RepID=UPI00237D4C83|nr:DUF5067 domain-containing protein [Jeotgalibaca caeni]MDE1550066.1 DUF5067 domain-containing protein [Jeotgalibaca caeni]
MKRKHFLYLLLAIIFLAGCTNNDTTDDTAKGQKTSPDISVFAAEYEEDNKRPYLEDDMYYTVNEEIKILSHEFITDQDGNPALVLWLHYKNSSDQDIIPMGVRSYFHFYQNEQELEHFAYLSEEFSKENPPYAEAYQRAIAGVSPGEEVEFYFAISLKDKSEVQLKLDEKNQSGDDNQITFRP